RPEHHTGVSRNPIEITDARNHIVMEKANRITLDDLGREPFRVFQKACSPEFLAWRFGHCTSLVQPVSIRARHTRASWLMDCSRIYLWIPGHGHAAHAFCAAARDPECPRAFLPSLGERFGFCG